MDWKSCLKVTRAQMLSTEGIKALSKSHKSMSSEHKDIQKEESEGREVLT